MGQLAMTVAGGVAGFLIGGPMGASIGMTLGGMLGSTLFGPTIKGPRLNDLKVSASTYGVAIPEIYGTVRLGGNMIWTSGIRETEKTERAGKGGPKQTTYKYDASFALALCKGPIDDVTRIWADGKLIFDKSNNSTRNPMHVILNAVADQHIFFEFANRAVGVKNGGDSVRFRLYKGTETQLPDSLIEADKGKGNVSAHRGMAYVVFERMPLEDFGNRIPQLTFEVTRKISKSLISVAVTDSDDGALPSVDNRTWIPDWELGRLISIANSTNRTDILDLVTMKSIYHRDDGINLGNRWRYIQGTGLLYSEEGSSNSRPMAIWDTFTLTRTGQLGNSSINLSGFFLNNCGEVPNQNGGAYSALGEMGYGYTASGIRHDILIGWTRSVWAFVGGSSQPLFYTKASFEPTFMIPARTNLSFSETVGWRSANGRLELEVWRISEAAASNLVEISPPGGCAGPSFQWEQAGAWSKDRYDLIPFEGESYSPRVVLFDPTDNCIFTTGFTNGVPFAGKWSIESETWKFARKHPGMGVAGGLSYSRLAGGTFGYVTSSYSQTGRFYEIDLQNGDLVRSQAYGSTFGFQGYTGQGQQWDDVTKSLIVETRNAYRRITFATTVSNLTIAEVVADICERTNVLEPGDYDTSGLNPDELTGFLIDRETTARDVLRQLATGFLFDGYESDYKLKFRSRGSESQVTIPEDWIGRDSNMEVIKETIAQELEMPKRITINYYDVTRDHQQGSQSAKRISGPLPSMLTSKEDIIDLPITWIPDTAKQTADKILKMAWANRTSYQMNLPWRYLKYDPTDVATVTLDSGTVHVMRLNETLIGSDFTIEAKGQSEKAAAYVSDAVGSISYAPPQVVGLSYPAFPFILNTPLLRDTDYDANETSICYLSVGTNALQFTSAGVYVSDGFDYAGLGAVTTKPVSGFAQSILPPTRSYGSTDEKTKLIVRLSDPLAVLESITQDEMLTNYANAAMVGEEVIQFRDAVLRSDGAWELSGLLRARRGTNYAVNSHIAGERFLLLDTATVIGYRRAPEDYSTFRTFKAVPTGSSIEEATGYSQLLIPRDLMPYTPEDIKVTDDDTTATVSMQRRSRVIAPLKDGTATIHYKEGDKPSAKITYQLWAGLGLADTNTVSDPTLSGTIPLFDANGGDIAPTFSFDLTELGGETKALLRLAEIGAVEGIPKFVALERLGSDLWNIDEFY